MSTLNLGQHVPTLPLELQNQPLNQTTKVYIHNFVNLCMILDTHHRACLQEPVLISYDVRALAVWSCGHVVTWLRGHISACLLKEFCQKTV
jgi:hypothetical protein